MNYGIYNDDNDFFGKIYAEYRYKFVRFANSYLRDWSASEDVVTDAFVQFWENKHELAPDSNVPAYLLTIVRNRCLNHLRHSVVEGNYSQAMREYYEWDLNTRISTLEACNPSDIYSDEMRALVAAALAKMPQTTREIFRMSREEGMTLKEIAEASGLSVKSVEYHIGKALKLLRKELKDYFPIFLLLGSGGL